MHCKTEVIWKGVILNGGIQELRQFKKKFLETEASQDGGIIKTEAFKTDAYKKRGIV